MPNNRETGCTEQLPLPCACVITVPLMCLFYIALAFPKITKPFVWLAEKLLRIK